MTSATIIAAIVIVSLFVYVIYDGINFLRKRSRFNLIPYILMVLGVIFLILIIYGKQELETKDWAQIILTLGLVSITAVYAWSTEKMAKATKKQAEEMREQRLSEARPYLLLRLTERVVQWNDGPDLREHFPVTFSITILNAGQGPALNLYTALWNRGESRYVHDRKGYLVRNEEWQAEISRFSATTGEKDGWLPQLRNIVEQNKPEIIAVEYEDIHKRTWVSYLYLEKHANDSDFVISGEQNIMEILKK